MNHHEFEKASVNLNTLWAYLVVQELGRCGVDHFYVSPGYRNGPFISALSYCQSLFKKPCPDERAAAYEALGFAKTTGMPAVLVCTSGTAACNYYPAVAEAFRDGLPLLVITSDRPFRLLHSGANQVLPQQELFAPFVKKRFLLPEPCERLTPQALLNHIEMGVEWALRDFRGPVHFNMPFDDPLGPVVAGIDQAYKEAARLTLSRRQEMPFRKPRNSWVVDEEVLGVLGQALQGRGVFTVGALAGSEDAAAVRALVARSGWPVYFDITSGLRGTLPEHEILDAELPGVRQKLEEYRPESVIHLGKRLVSKWFDAWLQKAEQLSYLLISETPEGQDPTHCRRLQLRAPVGQVVRLLMERDPSPAAQDDDPRHPEAGCRHPEAGCRHPEPQAKDLITRLQDAPFSFPAIAFDIWQKLSGNWGLFLGNSSTIRVFDNFIQTPAAFDGGIHANRGVSGIEGHVATALGLAEGGKHPVVAVLGDVSLIHDLNSLLQVSHSSQPIVIILINNHEGGIFRRLPVAAHREVIEPLMTTPHGFAFAGICAMAGLPYQLVEDRLALNDALTKALTGRGESMLVECVIDSGFDLKVMHQIFS